MKNTRLHRDYKQHCGLLLRPIQKQRALDSAWTSTTTSTILSVLSSVRAWNSVILAGKRDSRRRSTKSFSENVVVAETSYQMLEVLSFAIGRGLNLLQ